MSDTPSNIDTIKEAAFAELREIGRTEGKGKTARLKAAELITAKAKEGLFDESDNKRAWDEIIQGSGEGMADAGGVDVRDTQQYKQRCSDIKHFIVLGRNANLDGPAVLKNAIGRMRELRSSGLVKSGRIWELLLAFARNQNAQPTLALADKEIDRVMADKTTVTKRKALAEKLWAEREKLIKLNEGHNFTDIYEACELIEQRVKTLGGTKKQKLAAKEAAKQQRATTKAKAKVVIKKDKPTPPPAG
jgi:hypothetical protein